MWKILSRNSATCVTEVSYIASYQHWPINSEDMQKPHLGT